MAAFEFENAKQVRDVLKRHRVKYLFFGKSGAVLLGFSDTTQDVDLFVEKRTENCIRIVQALLELGFRLNDRQQQEIRRGKAFVQLKNGPFDLDLIFAPDGIEQFDDAWKRRVTRSGFPVASIDDIIRSKQAANRQRDRESLPRLLQFRDWLQSRKKRN